MLRYTVLFLIIALVAGAFGLVVIAGAAATIARVCFLFFPVLFVLSLARRSRPTA